MQKGKLHGSKEGRTLYISSLMMTEMPLLKQL